MNISQVPDDTCFLITSTRFAREILALLQENEMIRKHNYLKCFRAFSQFGEDYVIYSILQKRGVKWKELNYLEFGVNHPIEDNNTFFLDGLGAKGWLVEANVDAIPLIEICRRNCVLLNKAVVDNKNDSKEISFFVADNYGMSSIHENEIARKFGNIHKNINVGTIHIEDIMKEMDHIDVLSMDIEGLDKLLLLSTIRGNKNLLWFVQKFMVEIRIFMNMCMNLVLN